MRSYSSYSRSSYRPRSLRRSETKAKKKLFTTIIISGLIMIVFIFWGLPTLVGSLSFLNQSKKTQGSPIDDPAIAPPVLNIPYEATNTATLKIYGYSTPNSKVEIYVDDELKNTSATDGAGRFTTDNIELSQGKNNIFGKTLNEEGKKSLPSKTIVLIYSNQKPKLEVSSPPDNQQIKGGDKKINVSGETDPLNSITINGVTTIVSNDGKFSTAISINEGDNIVTIVSTDQFGNSNQVERKINYVP